MYNQNIYYSPEAYGLETVFFVDKSDGCYQFDTFVIWKDESGRYYWDNDSGCSCPVPFEDANRSNIFQGSLRDAVNDARVWAANRDDWSAGDSDIIAAKASIERFADENGIPK
jgi:hypothetical protein